MLVGGLWSTSSKERFFELVAVVMLAKIVDSYANRCRGRMEGLWMNTENIESRQDSRAAGSFLIGVVNRGEPWNRSKLKHGRRFL